MFKKGDIVIPNPRKNQSAYVSVGNKYTVVNIKRETRYEKEFYSIELKEVMDDVRFFGDGVRFHEDWFIPLSNKGKLKNFYTKLGTQK